jgi:Galactose oxidase, central domain/Kelch motif
MTARKLASGCLPAVLSFTVLLAGCGGGSSGSGTGGGGGTTPPPSTANEWTWMGGSDTVPAGGIPAGVYGTLGTASATNVPGGRSGSVSWTDGSGNLWLFGGVGDDSTTYGGLNDLWEFNPTAKEWTWVSGSNTVNANGIYGTEGIAATGNVPGSRYYAASWIDGRGNLWLFGGAGHDSVGTNGLLNDLWQFNPTTKEWTWVSGSSVMRLNPPGDAGQPGVYGTQGIPAANNVPGGRYGGTVSWIDSTGNLWLFGGTGFDSTGAYGELNDLWEFNSTTKTWTWVSGSSTANAVGVYGNMGVAAASDVPGARYSAVSWIDGSGNFWLFGGNANGEYSYLNDLWQFSPASKEWTWMSGSSTANATGVYGTLGVPSSSNVPGARYTSVSWIDGSGNLWLFGGGNSSTQGTVDFNDLWRYQP